MNFTVITSIPGLIRYEQRTFTSFKEVCDFTGGRFHCLHLPYEIDLWMNVTQTPNEENLSLRVKDDVDCFINEVYGNVFFAGHGKNGGTVSLTDQQKDWIYRSTEVVENIKELSIHAIKLIETEVA